MTSPNVLGHWVFFKNKKTGTAKVTITPLSFYIKYLQNKFMRYDETIQSGRESLF